MARFSDSAGGRCNKAKGVMLFRSDVAGISLITETSVTRVLLYELIAHCSKCEVAEC